MLESWHQWTCDGCGETEFTAMPDETRAQVRAYLRARGWRSLSDNLDYCARCVKRGAAKRKERDMNG